MLYYTKTIKETLKDLKTTDEGISQAKSVRRDDKKSLF